MCDLCASKITHLCTFSHPQCSVDGHFACFTYTGVIKNTLRAGKYFSIRQALIDVCLQVQTSSLCRFIQGCLQVDSTCVLVPVPLHFRRLQDRGFNQSEIIARKFGSICGIEVRADIVKRHRQTISQATLQKKEREKNVRGAFSYCGPPVPPKAIILVDDVWTTGSTIGEIAAVLKAEGVRYVWALTLAR